MPTLVEDHLIADVLDLESQLETALADAASYRHAFLAALDQLHLTTRRLVGAQQRLRQTMDLEPWHVLESE